MIYIYIKAKPLTVDLISLKEFKDTIRAWKEDEFIAFKNGAVKCSEIESIVYHLDEGVKDLGFWDTSDDESPKTPNPDNRKEINELED